MIIYLDGMSPQEFGYCFIFLTKTYVYLMGGFQGWQKKGYPVETKTNDFSPSTFVRKAKSQDTSNV